MKKFLSVLIAILGLMVFKANSQTDVNKYKSLFTINFMKYIDWPEAAKQGDFVIGVLKNDALADILASQTNGKKFGYQNIVVKKFSSIDEVTDCQILYISQLVNYNKNAEIVGAKLKKSNSLIITESNGAVNNGSMINFVVRDEVLKFEISETNAQQYGLAFSSSLTSMTHAIRM